MSATTATLEALTGRPQDPEQRCERLKMHGMEVLKPPTEEMSSLVQRVMDDTDPWMNPYFVALRDGSFEFEDFVETQVQFYNAVVPYCRVVALIAAKIPDTYQRLEVVRNAWEEHGEGNPEQTHEATMFRLLSRLAGLTRQETMKRTLWPEVRMFNTTLFGAVTMDEYLVGAGVVGMIERMFSDLSVWVGQGIVHRGWLTEDQLSHYPGHHECDTKHSQDFFDVLQPAWDRSNSDRYYIEQGLRLGAYVFNNLYEGLYRARKRRTFRLSCGPHMRA